MFSVIIISVLFHSLSHVTANGENDNWLILLVNVRSYTKSKSVSSAVEFLENRYIN